MERSTKRRYAPSGSDRQSGPMKRRQGGTQGRWQMPKQKAMQIQRGSIEVGDMGIWISCARHQEGKAAREIQGLFDEYAELMYGVVPPGEAEDSEEEEMNDIEASIKKELGNMGPQKAVRPFTAVRMNVDCLLFTKVRAPIEPVSFVHRICRDAAAAGAATGSEKGQVIARSTRYVNRLTPISRFGKATEKGVELLARIILEPYFELKPETQAGAEDQKPEAETEVPSQTGAGDQKQTVSDDQANGKTDKPAYSYAIRPTLRNHKLLKRDAVIKLIAGLIPDKHKVNLGAPDKVILVDIYQMHCGMSVVDGDWDSLKRYNLNELYHPNKEDPAEKPEASSAEVKPEEAPAAEAAEPTA